MYRHKSMKDYAPPWEADESNQPRKREMMHQKGSDMDECAIVDMYDLGCVKKAINESTPVTKEIRDEERQPMTSQYGHGDLSLFFWW